jgi:hypothetical protein
MATINTCLGGVGFSQNALGTINAGTDNVASLKVNLATVFDDGDIDFFGQTNFPNLPCLISSQNLQGLFPTIAS